jgi:hypothetical protein
MALDSSAAGSNQVVSVACGAQFIVLDVISSGLTVLQFDITFPSILYFLGTDVFLASYF